MKIQLKRDFAGRLTNEARILPGVYDSEDPALFGIAAYLVDNGFAVIIEEAAPVLTEAELIPVNEPAKPAPAKPPKVTPRRSAGQAARK